MFCFGICSVFTVDDGRCPPATNSEVEQLGQFLIEAKWFLKQLQSLNRSKGAGPDGLSLALANYIYQPLTMIYQYSIDMGLIPNDWKRSDPLNYRPISMTCIASKILEHFICHDMNKFLETHHLLSDCQHGFSNKHGCDTQLLSTTLDLIDSYDLNIFVELAVLDFPKAFDVLSHAKLNIKLGSIGIHESTCRWISERLSCRTLLVIVNSAKSSLHKLTSGVPQGSVLGPLFFWYTFNDMPSLWMAILHINR